MRSKNSKIGDSFQSAICLHLSLTHQYQLNAHLLGSRGISSLAKKMYEAQFEVLNHMDRLLERAMCLKETVELSFGVSVMQPKNLTTLFELTIKLIQETLDCLTRTSITANDQSDFSSRVIIDTIILKTETLLLWMSSECELIERIGENNYISGKLQS